MSATEVVETLEPKAQNVVYEFGLDNHLKFIQRPLSFFGKIELIAVLGEAIDKAIESGVSVAGLLEESTDPNIEANNFVRTLASLAAFAPDVLKEIYLISLGVPKGDREYVGMIMELPAEDGGLTDEQGIQILETFVDQNAEVMVDFFKNKILPMFNRVLEQVNSADTESSKPSNPTQPVTRKRSSKS